MALFTTTDATASVFTHLGDGMAAHLLACVQHSACTTACLDSCRVHTQHM
jgi:hypothetical protein